MILYSVCLFSCLVWNTRSSVVISKINDKCWWCPLFFTPESFRKRVCRIFGSFRTTPLLESFFDISAFYLDYPPFWRTIICHFFHFRTNFLKLCFEFSVLFSENIKNKRIRYNPHSYLNYPPLYSSLDHPIRFWSLFGFLVTFLDRFFPKLSKFLGRSRLSANYS